MSRTVGITHATVNGVEVTRVEGSILDALGRGNTADAVNLRIRIALAKRIRDYIADAQWTQTEAAAKLDVSQPHVSDIVRLKISKVSIDQLVLLLARLGVRVDDMLDAAHWPEHLEAA